MWGSVVSPVGSSSDIRIWKLLSELSRKLLELEDVFPAVLSLQQNLKGMKSSLTEASSAVCSFIWFLLIKVPAAEMHNNPVSDAGVPTNPDPWVLSWVSNPP